jgi:formylmethanofuran dehydrogenase subunit E
LIHVFRDKARQQKDEVVEVAGDKCRSCGRKIAESERAIVVDGELVCSQCEEKQ